MSWALWSDRAAGVVLGGAAGDALGAGYEFGPDLGPDVDVGSYGGGLGNWDPGEWTDDTQMASALLAPLAAGLDQDATPTAAAAGFVAWYESDPPDVGNQTACALRGARGDPTALQAAAARCQAARPDAAGNGSLMRTGPVGIAPFDRSAIAALATAVNDLTHPNPDCAAACVLWSDAITRFRDLPTGPPPGGWIDHVRAGLDLLDDAARQRWSDHLDTIVDEPPETFAPHNGWVVDAFRQALAALEATPVPADLWASHHLRDTLDRVVRGGADTDTVAAITGSLAGAAWGATAVPLHWQLHLHGTAASESGVGRATGADLARQARLAANGGAGDPDGWPRQASMLDFYRTNHPARPHTVPIDDHLAVGNVHALDTIETDVVIALCRIGPADGPPGATHLEVGLLDSEHPDANPNLVPLLADIAQVVHDIAREGKRAYLHCVGAQYRTPAALAAVLVHRGATPTDAIDQAEAVTGGRVRPLFRQALTALADAPQHDVDR